MGLFDGDQVLGIMLDSYTHAANRFLATVRGLFRTTNTLAKTLVPLRKENQVNSAIARYFTLKFLEAKRRYDYDSRRS